MGFFCCMRSHAEEVVPKKPCDSDDDCSKQQQQMKPKQEQQASGKETKANKSNLGKAAVVTPYFPFHSRPGLL
ncbi:hypothetical protein GUJ93_ZPchr0007g4731 [Zizania palustris]|uniref:Expressed protein-RZ53 n=1 Tax=Zizania palustris TaxID=103762 RepID=A0A8J5W5Z5_ZIZPA|nr:hypothetical protein GUJ93_ZPchr0007g4731 [Zizania palustris]